jgi:hypothetical protein
MTMEFLDETDACAREYLDVGGVETTDLFELLGGRSMHLVVAITLLRANRETTHLVVAVAPHTMS